MRTLLVKKATWGVVIGCFLSLVAGASIANADDDSGPPALAEIVVTAQKRAENLQEVPIAVTVLTSVDLLANGLNSTADLQSLVPGLVFSHEGSNGVTYLRGVGTNDGTFGAESPVATYLDGVYIMAPAAAIFSLNDIDRIEVLKGPQGTLFGRNSTGGVIQVITENPATTANQSMDVGYGNYNTVNAHYYGTTPIADGLSSNLALYGQDRATGYVTNLTDDSKIYNSRDFGLQNKWLWKPDDSTQLLLNGFFDYNFGSDGLGGGVFPGNVTANGTTYMGQFRIYDPAPSTGTNEQYLVSLKGTHEFGWGTLMNLAAIHQFWQAATEDQIGLAAPGYGNIYARADIFDSTITEEFQLQAPPGQDFQWVAGLYYLHDHSRDNSTIWALEPAPLGFLALEHFESFLTTDSYAGFAQATKTILAHTRLTLGVRVTYDEETLAGSFYTGGSSPVGSSVYIPGTFIRNPGTNQAKPFSPELSNTLPSWHASLDHDVTSDVMVYASYSRGFKSGGFNVADYTNPPTAPETLDDYELGAKSEWLDHRLRVNSALFLYNYNNMQLHSVGPNPPTEITYNAAAARIEGLDLDFIGSITGGLTISGGLEFMPVAKYTDFPSGTQSYANPYPYGFVNGTAVIPPQCMGVGGVTGARATNGGIASVQCDLTGNRLVRAPRVSGNLGIRDVFSLSNSAKITLSLNDSYNSGYSFLDDGSIRQPAYHDVKASATWTNARGDLDVQLWGTNLTNATILLSGFGGSSTYGYFPGEPRFFGVKAGVRF
jgi:iron complex outermembrane recepter protein